LSFKEEKTLSRFYSDVKVTPCTVASLSTGGIRPTVADTLALETKQSVEDSMLTAGRYSLNV